MPPPTAMALAKIQVTKVVGSVGISPKAVSTYAQTGLINICQSLPQEEADKQWYTKIDEKEIIFTSLHPNIFVSDIEYFVCLGR